jgi:hypothetical protein
VLSEPECTELVAFWRKEFDRSYDADFSVTIDPDQILYGAAARRAHHDWADIPHVLRRQWRAARRRRSQTIRKLAADKPEGEAPAGYCT